MSGHVLVVDDEPEMRSLLETDLGLRGFQVSAAGTATAALERLRHGGVDVVLTDIFMPGTTGVELCARITASCPDVPVVVMTAFGSMETAVEALRADAFDFVTKPVEAELLAVALRRAIEHRRLVERVRLLSHPVAADATFEDLRGGSPAMQRVRTQILRVAATDAAVLITGESGTGKELAAREICRHGRRRERPFVAVNCAALPAALLESELFGHARGAFTDARGARKGLFLEANGGTLFLDELGEIPLEVQPKLLRALEGGTIRPVGSDRELTVDVRVLAATNRDLPEAIAEGTFREDLYYRVNVVMLRLPALRDRGGEVVELARHFVAAFAQRHGKAVSRMAEPVMRRLLDYQWPGNVRELRNAIESAVVMARGEQIEVEDLPDSIREYRRVELGHDLAVPAGFITVEELERRHILQVLQAVGGRRSRAAEILGLDRKTLYRKLQRYGETVADNADEGQ
ncbi:MAG: sigma-54-dependent Fis family transcriptional regulator [Planctomycetes bacterium]|nr:sigma-54-dependent Fis family transcriptional regulator [Planctomycetota bacterium]